MKATRGAQPYRGGRLPGLISAAMKRGRSATGSNPMDTRRAAQRMARMAKAAQDRQGRKPRPARPPR